MVIMDGLLIGLGVTIQGQLICLLSFVFCFVHYLV